MARKKKTLLEDVHGGAASPSTPQPILPSNPSRKPSAPGASSLIICRNKHWRYISSFHGPWLQLPPEVLESLAWSNFLTPRPHPIDPACFFDLVKIRRAVDEATDLAVRAASGVSSAGSLSAANPGNGLWNNASASALGLGINGVGPRLSKERKHRMRELATQKLSQAYQLDEVAASVATMQSASTLEDLAHLVLQRSTDDFDARYVQFFHEKIPSRMMAQCTSLDPLNRLIAEKQTVASTYRTRALTRMFKDDWLGAAQDLTEGFRFVKRGSSQHPSASRELSIVEQSPMDEMMDAMRRMKADPSEQDYPTSLENQFLFNRANAYFNIAYRHANAALDAMKASTRSTPMEPVNGAAPPRTMAEQQAHRRHLELRKTVKTNARRALRDYLAFLSKFDYTPGIAPELLDKLAGRSNGVSPEYQSFQGPRNGQNGILNGVDHDDHSKSLAYTGQVYNGFRYGSSAPAVPTPIVYPISDLFSESPPADLPPYPPIPSKALSLRTPNAQLVLRTQSTPDPHTGLREAMTYHPLLTEAIHLLLLSHALLQTPRTELRRHAHNAARLARLADGYPVFLAARSPARADWVEVLRRADNWVALDEPWDKLCRPASQQQTQRQRYSPSSPTMSDSSAAIARFRGDRADIPPANPGQTGPEHEKVRRERRKQEAIMEALADERVVDEESFQRAVRARQRRAIEDELREVGALPTAVPAAGNAGMSGGGSASAAEKDFAISSERAESIARWVREAPTVVEGTKTKRRGKGKGGEKEENGINEEGKEGDDGPLANGV